MNQKNNMELNQSQENVCRKCGKHVDTLVDGLCLNCYNVKDFDLDAEEDKTLPESEAEDDYEDLQEKYELEANHKKAQADTMIVHGASMKDPHQQLISRQRTALKISRGKRKK